MKAKYNIGDIQFKTKKECETYTRNIINSLGCCTINKTHTQFNFFENLLKNHQEYTDKMGTGIEYFYIIKNPLNKKCFHAMIQRTDGSKTDFSWLDCCKFKKRSTKEDLTKAMREAVKFDMIEFKRSNKLICNLCNVENLPYDKYHIDHVEPSFKTLSEDFLKTKQNIPTTFSECKTTYTTIFKDEDKEFKNEWFLYHHNNCKLQVLCSCCNFKKH